jgi:copper homeostasis protein
VLGFLCNGTIDERATGRLLRAAGGKSITFHRAIEQVKDDAQAITTLQNYKQVNRILTNGGEGSWPERIRTLERLQRIALPDITVLVGGGLDEHILRLLAESPILNEFHTGRAARDADGQLQSAQVARLRKILDN